MEIGRSNEALWLNIGDEELIQGLTARLLLDPENWASAVKGDDRRLYHPEIINGLGLSQEEAESMDPPERVQTLARQPLD